MIGKRKDLQSCIIFNEKEKGTREFSIHHCLNLKSRAKFKY